MPAVRIHPLRSPRSLPALRPGVVRGSTARAILLYYREQGRGAMRLVNYRILFREEPEGGYTVTVPALSGCITFGETVDEAIAMTREAVEVYIEDLREKGEEVLAEEGLLEYTLTVEVPSPSICGSYNFL